MSAKLHVHAETPPLSWHEFKTTHPAGSIALDGYVGEGPVFDPNGPYLNANHHEGVYRLATLSTAQQILMDTRMGMDRAFSRGGEFSPEVFVNDCDEDVCTAWYLLDHVSETKTPSGSLNRFVAVAGTLDATAGAFPFDRDMPILGELAWVFEPFHDFRHSGEIANKDNAQYKSVIESVEHRIQQHLMGRGGTAKLDTRYSVVGGGQDWKMIREDGRNGRVGALTDGVDAYVTVQELPDERWRYTLGRRSEFIPFDIPEVLVQLNDAEGCTDDRWGGAAIIAGSPRVGASRLNPGQVEQIINGVIDHSR